MKINKYVFLITMFTVYILIGMAPWFRIKLAPPVEMSEFNGRMYYFYNNFIHAWGFKVIVALIIATIVSLIIRKRAINN
ncbi:hypothetical protein [uncultured Clostridium sp.]|uniref:hypothetical protein n=1 Tax=uncultured Clostridium sp. TaxID=59620 RepID=UPI0028E937EC|nr:hypothetical protein [uncultured Clostridium sp.]